MRSFQAAVVWNSAWIHRSLKVWILNRWLPAMNKPYASNRATLPKKTSVTWWPNTLPNKRLVCCQNFVKLSFMLRFFCYYYSYRARESDSSNRRTRNRPRSTKSLSFEIDIVLSNILLFLNTQRRCNYFCLLSFSTWYSKFSNFKSRKIILNVSHLV